MFGSLRKYIAIHSIRNYLKKSNRKTIVCGLKKAKKVAVLVNELTTEEYREVKIFMDYLASRKIKSFVIAYVHNNHIPEHYFANTAINVFTKKETGFWYQPKVDFYTEFLQNDIDIVINLCRNLPLPLEYFAHKGKSGLRVCYKSDQIDYDIEIDPKSDQMKNFIRTIIYYLEII